MFTNMTHKRVRKDLSFPLWGGKSFSQRRSNFPSGGAQQRAGELQANQLMAIGKTGVHHARLQAAYGSGEVSGVGKRGAGHFQRNPGGERQGAGQRQEHAARAEVQSCGKFKKFLAPLILAANENRDGQG